MPTDQAIAQAIYAAVTADQSEGSFFDDLAGQVYEAEAKQDDVLPVAVFNIITVSPFITFDSSDNRTVDVQWDVYHRRGAPGGGAKAVRRIHDKLVDLLDRTELQAEGFSTVSILCTSRGAPVVEEDVYRQTSEWLIQAA
jgi:hypothetical protein